MRAMTRVTLGTSPWGLTTRDPCTHCRLLYLSSPGRRAQQGKLGVFLLGRGHQIPRHLERKPGGSGVSSTFLGSPLHRGLVTALHSGAPPSSIEALGRGWGGNAREEHEWGCRKTLPKSLSCHRLHPRTNICWHPLPPPCLGSLLCWPPAQYCSFPPRPLPPLLPRLPLWSGPLQGCPEQSHSVSWGRGVAPHGASCALQPHLQAPCVPLRTERAQD